VASVAADTGVPVSSAVLTTEHHAAALERAGIRATWAELALAGAGRWGSLYGVLRAKTGASALTWLLVNFNTDSRGRKRLAPIVPDPASAEQPRT